MKARGWGQEEEKIILIGRSFVVCLFHTNMGRVGAVDMVGSSGVGFIGLESFFAAF